MTEPDEYEVPIEHSGNFENAHLMETDECEVPIKHSGNSENLIHVASMHCMPIRTMSHQLGPSKSGGCQIRIRKGHGQQGQKT